MIIHGYAAIWQAGVKRDGSDAVHVYLRDSLRLAEGGIAAQLFDQRIGHTNDGTLELGNAAIGLAFTLNIKGESAAASVRDVMGDEGWCCTNIATSPTQRPFWSSDDDRIHLYKEAELTGLSLLRRSADYSPAMAWLPDIDLGRLGHRLVHVIRSWRRPRSRGSISHG